MTTTQEQQTLRGVVDATNESGIQIGGRWYNFTRAYRDSGGPMPSKGETVSIVWHPFRTNQGRELRMVDDYESIQVPERQLDAPAHDEPGGRWLHDDKPVVTRLACLNAAVALHTQFGKIDESTPDDYESSVLGLAERFVSWATWGGSDSPDSV